MLKKRLLFLATMLIAAMATVSLYPQNRKPAQTNLMARGTAFRILLGVGETEPAAWDGSISVSPGRIAEIRGVRFSGKDTTEARPPGRLLHTPPCNAKGAPAR